MAGKGVGPVELELWPSDGMVDIPDLKSVGALLREGSTPSSATKKIVGV